MSSILERERLFDAGDYNLFRYCHSDPVDMTDPLGLEDHREPWPNHQEQAKALDRLYGEMMANAQRTMHGAHGGAIGIGKAGYNAWSALSKVAAVVQAQLRGGPSPEISSPHSPGPGTTVERSLEDKGSEKSPYIKPVYYWKYVFKEHDKPVPAGTMVHESVWAVFRKDYVGVFAPFNPQPTLPGGIMYDKYSAAFSSSSGYVTYLQRLSFDSGAHASFATTLFADGRYSMWSDSDTFNY